MKLTSCLALILFLATVPLRALAAVDMFLEIDGIEGEAKDRAHPNTINVLAFSWGMSNSTASQGAGAGKAGIQDLVVTKSIDKATTQLMQACATGQHIKKAVLYLRRGGDNRGGEKAADFFKITMEDIVISSLAVGNNDGGERPAESISINFAKVKVEYTGGAKGAQNTFEFDLGGHQEN